MTAPSVERLVSEIMHRMNYCVGSILIYHLCACLAAPSCTQGWLPRSTKSVPNFLSLRVHSRHPGRLRGGSKQEDAEIYLRQHGVPANLPELTVFYHSDTGSVPIEDFWEFDTTDLFLQRQPSVNWEDEGYGKCTLLMLDPDAPQRKGDGSQAGSMGPWLHWLVCDAEGAPERGKTIVEYMGPAPPRGQHRYLMLLLRQAEGGGTPAVASLERPRWDLAAFLAHNPSLQAVAYSMYYVDAGV